LRKDRIELIKTHKQAEGKGWEIINKLISSASLNKEELEHVYSALGLVTLSGRQDTEDVNVARKH
jgi:hypothetical protein